MGNRIALEMAEAVQDGLSLAAALEYHLRSNHYPPLPLEFVTPAMEAIDLANDGQWERTVTIPDVGIEVRGFGLTVPVWKLVEVMHLDSFIEGGDE